MTSLRQIAAIDPGLGGAIAFLGADLEVHDMPVTAGAVDAAQLAVLLRRELAVVVVERQQAMPRQGVSSSFKTGAGYGIVLGVVAALGHRIEVVAPGAWKRAAGVPKPTELAGPKRVTEMKDLSRRRAGEVFPGFAHLWLRKKDHGRAEAVLMAWANR